MKTQIKQVPEYFIDENRIVYNAKGDVITEENGVVRLIHEGLRRRFKVSDLTSVSEIKPGEKISKDLSKSDKAIVYLQWSAGEKDLDKLYALTQNKIKIITVKLWINQWIKGKNLPAIAKNK